MSNLNRSARIKPERTLTLKEREYVAVYIDRSVPEKHKIATQRALMGQIPRSTAIRVKCLQCCNYEREQIIHCTVLTCALHAVRPYQNKNVAEVEGVEEDDEQDS
jgi:hypothetical protein